MSYSSPESISSGDEPADTDYEGWKGTLRQCLKDIKSVGDIASFTRHTAFTNPGLKIKGHAAFPLPLTPDHAELVKGACRQAPFGKGDDTLVDTSVRNTWELEHNQFELLNPEWSAFLMKVGAESAGGLGLMNISLKPHKLLLYEKGSFFKRHKDTEKEPGMVGTMVVCLPSEHLGGDVHISFGSDTRSYSTAPTSRFDLTALAWYSDVSHEVKELEAGYRLALTYNIIQNGSKKQSAGFFGQQAKQIRNILLEWQTMFPDKATLIHRLDHKYSESSLSLRNMKGRDRAVCRALHEVASECGVYLLFAHLTRSEQGSEPAGYGYGYGDDGDDEDTYNDLKTLYSFDGKPIGSGDMPDDEEILELNKLSEGDPTARMRGSSLEMKQLKIPCDIITRSSGTLYTENMVQMVIDDMARFMEDQTANELARPPVLEVIRKALGSRGSSKVLTPVAVYWALDFEDSTLYRSAMTAAAKSGIRDIHNSAIKTACNFIEERFGDKPGSIEWDKWVGNAAETKTVADVQNIIHSFTPAFKKDVVRDSFIKWGESKLSDKFETQASFGIGEHLFFVKTIGEKHGNKKWLMSSTGLSWHSRAHL
ncbi:2OG-Fe(II) oxygenase [Colletotrichum tofieldiae]|nr:2OG-Fe(II) oxygenase [Colletotrichum tofieldiae]